MKRMMLLLLMELKINHYMKTQIIQTLSIIFLGVAMIFLELNVHLLSNRVDAANHKLDSLTTQRQQITDTLQDTIDIQPYHY